MLRHWSSVRSIKACRPPPPMPALAKLAVDPAEPLQGSGHRRFDRRGIADITDAAVNLARAAGHGRGGIVVFLGVAAPDRDVATRAGQRLSDAEPDAAIAAGDDGHASGEIEDTHECFQFGWARIQAVRPVGRMLLLQPWTSPPRKSNMAPK